MGDLSALARPPFNLGKYTTTSILQYGAVGDGVTSDTAAFTAAITSGANAILVSPCQVAYVIDGTVTLPDNVTLLGAGGIIRMKDPGTIVCGTNDIIDSVSFDHLAGAFTAQAIKTAPVTNGVWQTRDLTVTNCNFSFPSGSAAVAVRTAAYVTGIRLLHNRLTNGGFCQIKGARYCLVEGNNLTGEVAASRAIQFLGGGWNRAADNTTKNFINGVQFLSQRSNGIDQNYIHGNRIDGNTIITPSAEGISLSAGSDPANWPEISPSIVTVASTANIDANTLTITLVETGLAWAPQGAYAVVVTGAAIGWIGVVLSGASSSITVSRKAGDPTLGAGDKILVSTGIFWNLVTGNQVTAAGTTGIKLDGSCWLNVVSGNSAKDCGIEAVSITSGSVATQQSLSGLNSVLGNTVQIVEALPSFSEAIAVRTNAIGQSDLLAINSPGTVVKNNLIGGSGATTGPGAINLFDADLCQVVENDFTGMGAINAYGECQSTAGVTSPPCTARNNYAMGSLLSATIVATLFPFALAEWPVPKSALAAVSLRTWTDTLKAHLKSLDQFFAAPGMGPTYDYPNPRGAVFPSDLRTFLDPLKLDLVGQDYFYGSPGHPLVYDWPNPRGAAFPSDLRGFLNPAEIQLIGQDQFFGAGGERVVYEYPNPRGPAFPSDLRTFIDPTKLTLLGKDQVFGAPGQPVRNDWTVPRGAIPSIDLKTFLGALNLLLIGQDSFFAAGPPTYDYPNPRGPTFPSDLRTFLDPTKLNLLGQDQLFGVAGQPLAYDWQNPRGAAFPSDLRTWTVPLNQSLWGQDQFFGAGGIGPTYDWPNPPRGAVHAISLRTFTDATRLALFGQDQFFAAPGQPPVYDWPNPRGAVPAIELRWWFNRPPFGQVAVFRGPLLQRNMMMDPAGAAVRSQTPQNSILTVFGLS